MRARRLPVAASVGFAVTIALLLNLPIAGAHPSAAPLFSFVPPYGPAGASAFNSTTIGVTNGSGSDRVNDGPWFHLVNGRAHEGIVSSARKGVGYASMMAMTGIQNLSFTCSAGCG